MVTEVGRERIGAALRRLAEELAVERRAVIALRQQNQELEREVTRLRRIVRRQRRALGYPHPPAPPPRATWPSRTSGPAR